MRRELLASAAMISFLVGASAAPAQQQPGNGQTPSQQQQNKEQDQGIKTGSALTQQEADSEANTGEVKMSSPDQRAKVRQALLQLAAEKIGEANFPVKVGARVPETVKHHQLPVTVLDIAPGCSVTIMS